MALQTNKKRTSRLSDYLCLSSVELKPPLLPRSMHDSAEFILMQNGPVKLKGCQCFIYPAKQHAARAPDGAVCSKPWTFFC